MSEEPVNIESKVAPPTVQCPNCDSMLPHRLGEVTCAVCTAVSRIDHVPTREDWVDEKVACPACSKVLRVGMDERPCALRCSACESVFKIIHKVVKVEIGCPKCERQLRIRPRPGTRRLDCPACSESFRVTF
ncbi:MAG TPA: hypothetical protein EYQ80_05085 [Candidatus Poseidoniales archaeon]|nr:hypothetical protein [Candidatus Poseidoniales archaeon]